MSYEDEIVEQKNRVRVLIPDIQENTMMEVSTVVSEAE